MTGDTGPDPAMREALWARDGGRCVRCGRSTPGMSLHHRAPRRMGGTRDPLSNSPANLLHLCGSGTTRCHGWVESNRVEAYTAGFLLHDAGDAEGTPVFTYAGWVRFGVDGSVTPAR